MNYSVCLYSLLILLSFTGISVAMASEQGEDVEKPKSSLVLYFENDFFYGDDRYYTNAVKLRVISPSSQTVAKSGMLPEAFDTPLKKLSDYSIKI